MCLFLVGVFILQYLFRFVNCFLKIYLFFYYYLSCSFFCFRMLCHCTQYQMFCICMNSWSASPENIRVLLGTDVSISGFSVTRLKSGTGSDTLEKKQLL